MINLVPGLVFRSIFLTFEDVVSQYFTLYFLPAFYLTFQGTVALTFSPEVAGAEYSEPINVIPTSANCSLAGDKKSISCDYEPILVGGGGEDLLLLLFLCFFFVFLIIFCFLLILLFLFIIIFIFF